MKYLIITNYDSTYDFSVNINGKELSKTLCRKWENRYWTYNDWQRTGEKYFDYLRHYYGKRYDLIIYIENAGIYIVQDKERGIYEEEN